MIPRSQPAYEGCDSPIRPRFFSHTSTHDGGNFESVRSWKKKLQLFLRISLWSSSGGWRSQCLMAKRSVVVPQKRPPPTVASVQLYLSQPSALRVSGCDKPVSHSYCCLIPFFNMQASVIVAERARLCKRVPRGSELADCSSLGAVRAGHFGAKR